MRGTVAEVTDRADGRKVALVQLESGESALVAYWPELLEQWGADKLRGWLVHQAEQAAATAAGDDAHQALLGEADAAPVEITPPAPPADQEAPADAAAPQEPA
jgi:hypothetical protein